MKETWKDVAGFEGLYRISNYGNLLSLPRKKCIGGIKKPWSDKDGYLCAALYKDGKSYTKKIHRLVAEAFIDNPNSWPQVNHKDEVKTNNHADNLEWCTNLYNQYYKEKWKKTNKAIIQMDANGKEIARYESLRQASEMTGIISTSISQAANGRTYSAGKFKWKYEVK